MTQEWMVKRGTRQLGPLSLQQLRNLKLTDKLKSTDLVRQGETGDWKEMSSISGLLGDEYKQRTDVNPPPVVISDTTPAPSNSLKFSDWYKTTWIAQKPALNQGLLWLFYGWIWIPAWYLNAGGHLPNWAKDFVSWYKSKWLSQLPLLIQIPIWLFYGILWIPAWWYISTKRKGSILVKVALASILLVSFVLPRKQKTVTTVRSQETIVPIIDGLENVRPVDAKLAEHSAEPVTGTLEELGEEAFVNLPFANIDESQDIQAVPLSEIFVQSGTFTFRQITPDDLKASKTRQEWEELTVLGIKEKTRVMETERTHNFELSEGEPRSILEVIDGSRVVTIYPMLRIGAPLGSRWEWTNRSVSGDAIVSQYVYKRCVRHNNIVCVMIEENKYFNRLHTANHVRWYAEGIGLVLETRKMLLPTYTLESTEHRVVGN